MQTNIETFRARRAELHALIGISGTEHQGTLTIELQAARCALAEITVDTPIETVSGAIQREAALARKVDAGLSELQKVEAEIAKLESIQRSEGMRIAVLQGQKQQEVVRIQGQIASIDAMLDGTNPIIAPRALPSDMDGGDYVRFEKAKLRTQRVRLVEELGQIQAAVPA